MSVFKKKKVFLSILVVIAFLFLFYCVQYNSIRTDSESTKVGNILMEHSISKKWEGNVLVRVKIMDLKYDDRETISQDLFYERNDIVEITDTTGTKLKLKTYPVMDFTGYKVYSGNGSNDEETGILKKIKNKYLLMEYQLFMRNMPLQPYLGEEFRLTFEMEDSEKFYEGPIEIKVNNSTFSKVFIGEVKDGWLEVQKEKVVLFK